MSADINLDEIIEIDKAADPNEVEEMESIAEQLYSKLKEKPWKFSDYETNFIEDMFRLDVEGYTPKQIAYLYKLDRKYLQ